MPVQRLKEFLDVNEVPYETLSHSEAFTAQETAALAKTNFNDVWADQVPAMLRFVQQDGAYQGKRATDAEVLARIGVPVLLLTGQQSRLRSFFNTSADFIAKHVPDAHSRELPGVGHVAPVLAAESVADELTTFFASARTWRPARPWARRENRSAF